MPTGEILATVVSRETKVATGVPVSGFVVAAVRATISWFSASKPSTHTDHAPPTGSASHAFVSGQRSRMRTTRWVRTTILDPTWRYQWVLMVTMQAHALFHCEYVVSMAPIPANTVTVFVAGQSGGGIVGPASNDAAPAGMNDKLSDESNFTAVSGKAGTITAPKYAISA